MKSSLRLYKGDQDRKICSGPQTFTVRRYIYLGRSQMTTLAAERLATESYKKLLSPKTRPF